MRRHTQQWIRSGFLALATILCLPGPVFAAQPIDQGGLDDPGVLSVNTYLSPQFGYLVRWREPWFVRTAYTDVDPDGRDQLTLSWMQSTDDNNVYLLLRSPRDQAFPTVDAAMRAWLDPAFVSSNWGPEYEVKALLDGASEHSGTVLYSVVETGKNRRLVIVFQAVEVASDRTVLITFSASAATSAVALGNARSSVELNGHPILDDFDEDELQRLPGAP